MGRVESNARDELIRFGRAVVMHRRERPFVHSFVYKVFCMQVRVDRLDEVAGLGSWLFGVNRMRVVNFREADHGDRSGSDLMKWLDQTLARAGLEHPGGATWLQCFPRLLGYVFNPVSFWMLHDPDGRLTVILAEVNNTFGQRHQYVLTRVGGGQIDSNSVLHCQKVFHVSPFCEVTGHYRFKYQGVINAPLTQSATQRMSIDYFDDPALDVPLLRTSISVKPLDWTTARLFKALIRFPFMTIGVMVRIHWHALKLWRKGARFHRLPSLPESEVSTRES